MAGQALGLPPFMALFTVVGLAVTSASAVMYGAPIIYPVELLTHVQQPAAVVVALFGLVLAVLTTNIAANVVSAGRTQGVEERRGRPRHVVAGPRVTVEDRPANISM